MDIETARAHPKGKLLVDAIYLNPLTKDRLSEMYKKNPRPADLETLHKTRLYEDLARQMARKSKESVILGEAPMRSLQGLSSSWQDPLLRSSPTWSVVRLLTASS